MCRVTGLGVGLVLAIAVAPLVRMWTRGHSRSALYFTTSVMGLGLALPLLCMSGIVVLNAAADPSPPERLSGKVTTAAPYLDDGEPRVHATAVWTSTSREPARTELLDLADPRPFGTKAGDEVIAVRRAGLLGFAWWETEPAIKRFSGGRH